MISDDLDNVLIESERLFLKKDEPVHPTIGWIERHILYPFKMVSRGLDFFLKEFSIYIILYIILMYFVSKISSEMQANEFNVIYPYLGAFVVFCPLFIILFSPPTVYANSRYR